MARPPRVTVAAPSIPTSRVSAFIADYLRRQIIRGTLKEGDALPPEGELIAEWGVSRATLREAFRVLETESLITVQRGARGGARVNAPRPQVAARQVGHLLQYRGVTVGDVARGVIVIQPRAVHLLTERQPAAPIDALDACLSREGELLEDPVAFGHLSLEFGRTITDGCGDEVLRVFGEILFYLQSATTDYIMLNHFGARGLEVEGRNAIKWILRRQERLMTLVRAGEAMRAERHWHAFLEKQLAGMPEVANRLAYDAWPSSGPGALDNQSANQ